VPPLNLFFTDQHDFPLPAAHKFPLRKYRMVREAIEREGRFALTPAPFAIDEDLLRVHDPGYVSGFRLGTLAPAVMRRIGFPWSQGLVARTLASVGGTLAATAQALQTGFGGTLAGGTHHAFRSEGAGFCVFNDLAVAAEWARRVAGVSRVVILDLDVHQGDGTAAIFQQDPDVFTISLHGAQNFPFRKQRSRLDVEFPDGTRGPEYLEALARAMEAALEFGPGLVLFQSGVDTLCADRLGRLALTPADLASRDKLVFSSVLSRSISVVVTLGGGYGEPIEESVEAHAQTFRIAADVFGKCQSRAGNCSATYSKRSAT
jgi:acetoin utilization deacetylase AcuC-like enzyme